MQSNSNERVTSRDPKASVAATCRQSDWSADWHSLAVILFTICEPVSVASLAMGQWGTCPLKFWKLCAFCSCCQF